MWSAFELFSDDFRINVVDVGAALIERPPYQSLIDQGRARVIGFEPNFEECEKLNATFGAPHTFLPYFVGDGTRATFHETNSNFTGSLYEPNTPLLEQFQSLAEWTQPVQQHVVQTTRLDDIEEIGDVDYIKIDVQGGELDVFRNASKALSTTLLIHTEVEFVELYKRQPLFSDVDAFLRSARFQFHAFDSVGTRAFKPLVRDGDLNRGFRQLLWSDVLYVRDWMNLAVLSVEKLRNYAVLAHDLLGSYDLAHLALTELDRKTGGDLAAEYRERLSKG